MMDEEIPMRISLAHAVEEGMMTKNKMKNVAKTTYWYFTPKQPPKKEEKKK